MLKGKKQRVISFCCYFCIFALSLFAYGRLDIFFSVLYGEDAVFLKCISCDSIMDEIFLFFVKVVTLFIFIVATLAPIVIAIAFCYGFYKDYLCLPPKNKAMHINGSFHFNAREDSSLSSRVDSLHKTNDTTNETSCDAFHGNIGDNLSI